jgi:multidrug efflux system outer membrane protein
VLSGLTPAEVDPILTPEPLPSISPKVLVGIPASVIANRPDVQVAERDLAAATANQGIAIANWFPKVSLTGLFGMQKTLGLPAFGTWNQGVGVNWSLIDFGHLRALVREANAQQQAALATYEQTIKAALADVESSLVGYAQAQRRAAILAKAAEASRQAEMLARIQYSEGIASLLDVLQAQQQRLDAETSLAQAQADVGERYAALYKALGGGHLLPSGRHVRIMPVRRGERLCRKERGLYWGLRLERRVRF